MTISFLHTFRVVIFKIGIINVDFRMSIIINKI